MTIALNPYPRMKDSGVEVLGFVPEHWNVKRLGNFGAFSKGNGGNKDDATKSGVPCVRYGDIYTTHKYFIEMSQSFVSPRKAKNYTSIRFGDVLFAGSGETIDEIGKSAVNFIRSEACCGGDVILFRPRINLSARYFGYAADCAPSAIQKARMGRGITVMHIYGNELKNLKLALPPRREQTAIARFLDHMDRRIQKYIRAKEKLIALLEERSRRPISPGWMQRSASSRIRNRYSALNRRRVGLATTSGSGARGATAPPALGASSLRSSTPRAGASAPLNIIESLVQAGPHPPSRHRADRCPDGRAVPGVQALRCRVLWEPAVALAGCCSSAKMVSHGLQTPYCAFRRLWSPFGQRAASTVIRA